MFAARALLLLSPLALGGGAQGDADVRSALATITAGELEAHVAYLASPELEGRDSPSRGLELAARHVCKVFAAAGLAYAPDSRAAWDARRAGEDAPAWARRPQSEADGTYLRPYTVDRLPFERRGFVLPDAAGCALTLGGVDEPPTFAYGEDFVPVAGFEGRAEGELLFAGFGIRSKSMKYDDLKGVDATGKVALFLEGEPRHKSKFEGPEVTAEAAVWNKLDKLALAGIAGALIVRRSPEVPRGSREPPRAAPLGFRYTRATWNDRSSLDRWRANTVPALEITEACASALLGQDVVALAARLDRTVRPLKVDLRGRSVAFTAATRPGALNLDNVVGVVPGSDPALRDEYVVIGAHYDHVGVGLRGRTGYGADDNASGTSAMLEIAQALAALSPRRSLLLCAFSAEEDGLLGSRELARALPVPREKVVAMLNLDMLGRGEADEVVVMGVTQNPGMAGVLRRALKSAKSGVRNIDEVDDAGLFQRSDHYSFHEIGVPTLFFFEGYPLEKNKDYHTWRDTPDKVDAAKVEHSAKLALLTAWILANDDERLPAPGG
jgi:hypothetical protein